MSEERQKKGFWARLFGSGGPSARERRVLEYIAHRLNEGANLHSVLEEEYVRRNASQGEINEIASNPQVVEAARESMEKEFKSGGDLDPNRRAR
ncbi:MAG TPA: hypothetical protein VFE21_00340 [Rubrobacteraceae bacterium]|nr:hypothetical protein [Rubrobacteraceae bacterium]